MYYHAITNIRNFGLEANLHEKYRAPQTMGMTIPSAPTFIQAELIVGGHTSLPLTFKNDFEVQVGCEVVYRGSAGEAGRQIDNRFKVELRELEGIPLLRVCKQLRTECSASLYGENTFAFITGGGFPSKNKHAHQHDELPQLSNFVTSLEGESGRPESQQELVHGISSIFEPRQAGRRDMIDKNPMLEFFHRIGQFNTSFLSKVELEGKMKTMLNADAAPFCEKNSDISFPTILSNF
jgi:hypothetical protein